VNVREELANKINLPESRIQVNQQWPFGQHNKFPIPSLRFGSKIEGRNRGGKTFANKTIFPP
jgi:hypothetical protein